MNEKRFGIIKTKTYGLYVPVDKMEVYNFSSFESELDCIRVVNALNDLSEENEQLKKDATILIYSNQDYRQENENLKKQLDYIQNSINEHIKHQKTELAAKALKEIIEDYNEWMLGHKELKE